MFRVNGPYPTTPCCDGQAVPRPPPSPLDALRAVLLGGLSFLAFLVLFVGGSYYARRQAMRSMVSSSAAVAAARADLAATSRDTPSFAPKEYNKARSEMDLAFFMPRPL